MFLLVVTAIVTILFLACIGVNLYLQSQGVRERISQAANGAIGTKVTIKSISYTPWSGIVLGRVGLSNADHPSLLEIATIRLHIPWIPLLFQRKVILSSVEIDKPVMKLTQKADTSWNLLPEKYHAMPRKTESNSAPAPLPSSPTTTGTTLSTPSPEAATKPFPAPLTKIVISKGKFLLVSKQGNPIVIIENIHGKLTASGEGHLLGPLTCNRIIVANSLFLKDFRTSLSCTAQTLEANPVLASLAGGQILGEFRCQFGKRPAFEIKAKVVDVALYTLLKEAGYPANGSSGSLRGNLWVYGLGSKLEPQGNGSLELVQGQLEPVDFLRQLGRILRIQELELLHLKKAVSSFQIQSDRLVFDNIFLESHNLILMGTGPVRFDGRLDIAAQLLFNNHLYSQFQGLVGKNLSPSSISGYHKVDFRVSGRTSCPKTDLLDKLTGIQIRGNITGFLQNLIGRPGNRPPSSPSP